jgi:dihydrofolate reductase
MSFGRGGGLDRVIRYSTSISLDGFTAGVDQSPDDPLGVGGMRLHGWLRELAVWRRAARAGDGGVENASTAIVEGGWAKVGAFVMGRNMFGGAPGPWGDDPWNGWWGENPPFHQPVFVVTHHPRAPLECEGGTTFTFVTDGVEAAVDQARAVADGRDVSIAGGATVARQCLAAGLIDELVLHLVPVVLGGGVRLFDDPGLPSELEQVSVVEAPGVAHLFYRTSVPLRSSA